MVLCAAFFMLSLSYAPNSALCGMSLGRTLQPAKTDTYSQFSLLHFVRFCNSFYL